ncbi:DUF7344 domain-containing protein [Halocatena pleomorpha]|uniref:DUF7344 domain-containing protein n=1 Tax=Halocatena pleomorpha TaxID=1785090 RepID=UPI001C89AE9B|nr:hypothetical protein [Halocatena pleomorpha]
MSTMNAVANTDAGVDTNPEPRAGEDSRSTASDDRPSELSKDELFHLLQNQRRRQVLEFLQDTDGEINMRDIAEQVAAWENDTTIDALDSNERQRVYIALYQSHLPKLDEAGVLTYNQQRGIVSRTALADQLDAYLNIEPSVPDGTARTSSTTAATPDHTDDSDTSTTEAQRTQTRFLRYYGAATVGSVLSIAVSMADIIALSQGVLVMFITALFAMITVGIAAQHHEVLPS